MNSECNQTMSNAEFHLFTDPHSASHWLKKGKLLAYPTESVWGIGCDAFNQQVVKQILAIKNRPVDKGMIVVTDSVERISNLLALLPNKQRQTILASWQMPNATQSRQATTWLLPLTDNLATPIPNWITGKHNSVAVRVINHPLIKTLCANMVSSSNPYGFIVSTSCNPSGEKPAMTLNDAQAYFAHSSNASFTDDVGYLLGDTLGYTQPSQIRDGLTGEVIR